MAIVPDTRIGKIEFYETHLAPWGTNAVAIGLTAAEVTAFGDLVKNARTAYDAHQAAQEAAKAATVTFYNTVSIMQVDGAGLIRTIKNKARVHQQPQRLCPGPDSAAGHACARPPARHTLRPAG